MTTTQKQWIRWITLLAMAVSLVLTPATSTTVLAESEQIGPSSYLPTLSNNYCSGQRSADAKIGTQVYGITGKTQPHYTLLQNTQSYWLRNTIYWSLVEPTNVAPSQYNWTSVDNRLLAARDNCVNMIVTIEGTPSWAAIDGLEDGRAPIRSENLPDFVQFVTALVDRYDGDGTNDSPLGIVINHWEFYNEPDFGSEVAGFSGWGEYGARYAQMLQAIYQPVHDTNPNAKVVFGGIAYNLFANEGSGGLFVRDFFKNVLDAGGGDYFDIMNFHYYPFQHNRSVWTNTNASGLKEKYASLKAMLDEKGLTKPLMITEVGWHSATTNTNYPSNPEYQARRVLELLTQAMSIGSKMTIWWTFFDERQDFSYKTGLTTADNVPATKPSYAVYKEAVRRLANSEFVEVTVAPSTENDLEAYRFRDPSTNKTFYVAWLNPIVPVNAAAEPSFDNNATQTLTVPGNRATIYNKDGSVKETVTGGGTLTITVGRSPIYIVIN